MNRFFLPAVALGVFIGCSDGRPREQTLEQPPTATLTDASTKRWQKKYNAECVIPGETENDCLAFVLREVPNK